VALILQAQRTQPGVNEVDFQLIGAHMFATRKNGMCLSWFMRRERWRVTQSSLSFAAEPTLPGAEGPPAYILPDGNRNNDGPGCK